MPGVSLVGVELYGGLTERDEVEVPATQDGQRSRHSHTHKEHYQDQRVLCAGAMGQLRSCRHTAPLEGGKGRDRRRQVGGGGWEETGGDRWGVEGGRRQVGVEGGERQDTGGGWRVGGDRWGWRVGRDRRRQVGVEGGERQEETGGGWRVGRLLSIITYRTHSRTYHS